MQIDPVQEWQRLTAEYREKYDNELLELARDFPDLTETAQQALRQEMQTRNLGNPESPKRTADPRSNGDDRVILPSGNVERKNYDLLAGLPANSYIVPDDEEESDNADGSTCDYTWKTLLCECNEVCEAQQLSGALERAGIQSWIEAMPSYGIGLYSPRVFVAADQLEQARTIASQPIPQDIIDDSKVEVPDYVVPKCPKCGADDPILEAVEPSNTWRCEQCDKQWTDASPATAEESPKG